MPENENEILIPEHLASNGNVHLSLGDTLELVNRGEKPHRFVVEDLRDGEGTPLQTANHPMMVLRMRLPAPAERLSVLRKIKA